MEPVRKILRGKGNYFEATVEKILPDEKVESTVIAVGRCVHAAFCHFPCLTIVPCLTVAHLCAGCGGMFPQGRGLLRGVFQGTQAQSMQPEPMYRCC